MNFQTVRHIYVDWQLRILGYQDPEGGSYLPPPLPSLRRVSCQHVHSRLSALSDDVRQLKDLHTSQQTFKPTGSVDRTLKAFCQCAGAPLIRAFETVEATRAQLEAAAATGSDSDSTFSAYQGFRDALLEIRKAHAVWEVSAGEEAFFRKQTRARAVRFEYLWFLLKLVYTLADLTFPEEYHGTYLEGLGILLGREDWREQFLLDSEATYALSKRSAVKRNCILDHCTVSDPMGREPAVGEIDSLPPQPVDLDMRWLNEHVGMDSSTGERVWVIDTQR